MTELIMHFEEAFAKLQNFGDAKKNEGQLRRTAPARSFG